MSFLLGAAGKPKQKINSHACNKGFAGRWPLNFAPWLATL